LPERLGVGVDKDRVDAIGLRFLHIRQDNMYLTSWTEVAIFVCVARGCFVCEIADFSQLGLEFSLIL
jgi:hypothetical protein